MSSDGEDTAACGKTPQTTCRSFAAYWKQMQSPWEMMKSGNEQVLNDIWNDARKLYRSELDKRIADDSCSDLKPVSSQLDPVCLKLSDLLMSQLHASTPENHISTYSEWLNNACTKGKDMYVSTMDYLCENPSKAEDDFNSEVLEN